MKTTDEWLNKEPAQGIGWKRTKAGRIRLLEERVAKLEEEVRTLTAAMRGAAPTVPIIPWKSGLGDPILPYGPPEGTG